LPDIKIVESVKLMCGRDSTKIKERVIRKVLKPAVSTGEKYWHEK